MAIDMAEERRTAGPGPGVTDAVVGFGLEAEPPFGAGLGLENVLHPMIDALGVCVAGSGSDVARTVRSTLRSFAPEGTAESGFLLGPHGAFALGSMGHALDYDDSVPLMPGHPSVPVMAALMALPTTPGVGGHDLLQAYAVGVEVAAKVGKAAGGGHYRRGWHATSTHGCIGAVVALGRLHGLSPAQLRTAVGIAVSGVSGVQANFGTMTKPLHAGFAAQRAVEAVVLAQEGATASEESLESPQGYYDVYGTEASQPELLLTELGAPWAFEEPGIYLKRYPCCYATHRAIAGTLTVMRDSAVAAANVERIACLVPIGGLRPLRAARPKTGLEGKFSLEYAIAATLLDGEVGLRTFDDAAVNRPEAQELIRRCRTTETAECCPDDPEGVHGSAGTRGFVRLRFELRDGTTASVDVHVPPGAGEFRLTVEEVSDKFVDCLASAGTPSTAANELLDTLLHIDEQDDVSDTLATIREMCATPAERN